MHSDEQVSLPAWEDPIDHAIKVVGSRFPDWRPSPSMNSFARAVAQEVVSAITRPPLDAPGEVVERLVNEFESSLEQLERNGPDLTCADGEFVRASTLTDRADLIRECRAALTASDTAKDERIADRPRRAHVLKVEMGANTLDDLVIGIQQLAIDLRMGTVASSGCSGSPSVGFTYDYSVDEAWTKDCYFEAIDRALLQGESK